jgi:hypothetical protein
MKKVVIVAPHFVPSNLASVHRARLWSQHLPEFGWQPIVVTTHHRHYEEALDYKLVALVEEGLRVIETPALPTKPIRVVGDIGVRAMPFHYRALSQLARAGEMDVLVLSIPSNYAALLGPVMHKRFGVPYGIDYNDPWVVDDWPPARVKYSKAWASAKLARLLEPIALTHVELITGVAPAYYEAVLQRHPRLRTQAVTAAMPYGGSTKDFARLAKLDQKAFVFDPNDGNFHLTYAGTMWPPALPVLDRLLEGVAALRAVDPHSFARLRMHFIGTSLVPDDASKGQVQPYIDKHQLAGTVDEHAKRISYVDVLTHAQKSSANLILGSTEPHYTPSKAFHLVHARRPMLALLHRQSSAASFLREANAASVVELGSGELPSPSTVAHALSALMRAPAYDPAHVRWEHFEAYSARASARSFAEALDEVLARRAQAKRIDR